MLPKTWRRISATAGVAVGVAVGVCLWPRGEACTGFNLKKCELKVWGETLTGYLPALPLNDQKMVVRWQDKGGWHVVEASRLKVFNAIRQEAEVEALKLLAISSGIGFATFILLLFAPMAKKRFWPVKPETLRGTRLVSAKQLNKISKEQS